MNKTTAKIPESICLDSSSHNSDYD